MASARFISPRRSNRYRITRMMVPAILNGRWIEAPASRGKWRTMTSATFQPATRQRV